MKNIFVVVVLFLITTSETEAQENYRFMIDVPVFDYPENTTLPHRYPSMDQALKWSGDLYELAFWGIDETGDLIFPPENNTTWLKKTGNTLFKYALGVAFSKYGSELPIPLGVWAHEEFHRSVLGTRDIGLKNGNWLFSRWDGTVYGVSDETLEMLKADDPRHLLYSYVAGVQYEILLNEKITLDDFSSSRNFPKGPLVLYNAYYVWNYFRFSASSASDSSKILAPPHEDIDPAERDFTGADLNAWVYDMFNPAVPFTARDPFPGGHGVNRRIGFSDLSEQEKDYLKEQKQLSLLNFLNPAIFLIDRIRISDNFSFSFFTQYAPVHFGNSIAAFLPLKINNTGYLLSLSRFSNNVTDGIGIGAGVSDLRLTSRIYSDIKLSIWNQPETFFQQTKVKGGSLGITAKYSFSETTSAYIFAGAKTKGWLMGNPYLDENFSFKTGFIFKMRAKG